MGIRMTSSSSRESLEGNEDLQTSEKKIPRIIFLDLFLKHSGKIKIFSDMQEAPLGVILHHMEEETKKKQDTVQETENATQRRGNGNSHGTS